MFTDATSIQTDLSRWNVQKVTNFESFASGAGFLNTNIEGWDVSSGQNFADMFARRSGMVKNLCAWGPKIHESATVTNMFGVRDTTVAKCPSPKDPVLTMSPPGPFCHSCDTSSNSGGNSNNVGSGNDIFDGDSSSNSSTRKNVLGGGTFYFAMFLVILLHVCKMC